MPTFACIVGVGHYRSMETLDYAEADAREIFRILTDKENGTCAPEHGRLLLSLDADAKAVTTELSRLVEQVRRDDLFVVYFAGHAERVDGNTYLLFHGDDPAEVSAVPLQFKSLEAIVSWIGGHCAGTALFIIDACNVLDTAQDIAPHSGQSLQGTAQQAGVILLFSSDLDGSARESAALGHGQLTAAMIRRLRGGAGSGPYQEVTVRDLVQTAGSAFSAYRVISDPPIVRYTPASITSVVVGEQTSGAEYPTQDLSSPLDGALGWLEDVAEIMDLARQDRTAVVEQERQRRVLQGLVSRFGLATAHQVATALTEGGRAKIDLLATPLDSTESVDESRILMQRAASNFGELLFNDQLWSRSRVGMRTTLHTAAGEYCVIAFPLDSRPHSRFIFLYLPFQDSLIESEHFVKALSAAMRSAEGGASRRDVLSAELDAVREIAGFVPLELYRKRLDLFGVDVSEIVPYFQPIVSLTGQNHIEGFEALARVEATPDNESGDSQAEFVRTPHDLFFIEPGVVRGTAVRDEVLQDGVVRRLDRLGGTRSQVRTS